MAIHRCLFIPFINFHLSSSCASIKKEIQNIKHMPSTKPHINSYFNSDDKLLIYLFIINFGPSILILLYIYYIYKFVLK
ncbi:hypothetical protein BpHYR1_016733 [Brachionus plicatilis]|uniref:Uncharacterized protein n=1 Tax=Brachionus plicatilis TaxID=10195 RepID=A0A3M7QL93_BRAPC|nr:hypothetical protein BpHYR1_016733 [Brachionus plicatilis]